MKHHINLSTFLYIFITIYDIQYTYQQVTTNVGILISGPVTTTYDTPSLKKLILGPKQPPWETLIFLRDSPRLSGINNF